MNHRLLFIAEISMLTNQFTKASAEESLRRQLSFKREMEGFEKRLRAQLHENSLLLKQGRLDSVDHSFVLLDPFELHFSKRFRLK